MERFLDTLYLHRGDPAYTPPEAIDKMVVLQRQGLHPVVIVDYAQGVPRAFPCSLLVWGESGMVSM